jgi:hypothetical protein
MPDPPNKTTFIVNLLPLSDERRWIKNRNLYRRLWPWKVAQADMIGKVHSAVPILDLRFPHRWQAEVLTARPLILPTRHFIYPREAEEIERGALEVLVRPDTGTPPGASSPGSGPASDSASGPASGTWETADDPRHSRPEELFLATCALGFRDPAVPTGLWSTPKPEELCAVSGGYAYLIDTTAPERFTMLPYRPVLAVHPAMEEGLLLFVGHHSILAWGREGQAWESEKLSDEGVTITGVEGSVLRGMGWAMSTDRETEFALDLATGKRPS